ncbi:MAG: hypothetical protein IID05_14590 [Gemmatimonadetes bacterium]|nr:hypothetical protein [Gemmatimonadota bacterium]
MAANIGAYRDSDDDMFESDAVPVRKYEQVADEMQTDDTMRYLGLEAHPFLVEAFIAHVHEGAEAVFNHNQSALPIAIDPGDRVLCFQEDADPRQSTIVVVQIANPFNKPVTLFDSSTSTNYFQLRVYGQPLDMSAVVQDEELQPNEARTYVSMQTQGVGIGGNPISVTGWEQVLTLDLIADADLVRVDTWSKERGFYDGAAENQAIELWSVKNDPILVDRIDIRPGLDDEPSDNAGLVTCDQYQKFGAAVREFANRWPLGIQLKPDCDEPIADANWLGVHVLTVGTHWAQWVRASRPWQLASIDAPDELNPRYVFSRTFLRQAIASGEGRPFTSASPSSTWFSPNDTIARFAHKDKQVCVLEVEAQLPFAMQMLQKDGEFEQVGELLNVWLFGHEIETTPTGDYVRTTSTFSEWMWEELFESGRGYLESDERRGVNRLRGTPVDNGTLRTGAIMGGGDPNLVNDLLHAYPAIPATSRVLEAFVCDGHGANLLTDINGDSVIDQRDAELRRPKNANGFTNRMTPGLININTATPEVMWSLPHMARLVGLGPTDLMTGEQGPVFFTPRVHVAEAVVGYRDRIGATGPVGLLPEFVPRYANRATGLRVDRGFASIGEMLLLTHEPPNAPTDPKSWRIDFAAVNPFNETPVQSTRLSTDVVPFDPTAGFPLIPDEVAGDSEEANLLFAGMSNMITTRSDVFTVYFKIRSFTQNPVTGRWDATDPEHIVDDSRYVMLVDRSEVNVPSDKPKIVYLEKLPK